MEKRTCPDCGIDISERHRNAKRCHKCSQTRAKQQQGQGVAIGTCNVDDADCVPGRLRSGMCERHWRRNRRTGTTSAQQGMLYHLTRFLVDDAGCWVWTGPLFWNGYGHISQTSAGTTLAHRAFYEAHIGTVPDGMDLDHLCRNRACVNPKHLEPVTRSVNLQRGVDARMGRRCKRGHDQDAPDAQWVQPSSGRVYCRECKSQREREGRQRRKAG